jgi:hypothetical protein
VAVLDQYGDLLLDLHGEAVPATPGLDPAELAAVLDRHTRRVGPVTIGPEAWVITGSRCLQVPDADPSVLLETVAGHAVDGSAATIVIGRE